MFTFKSFFRAIEISRPVFWPSTFLAFVMGVIFSKNPITPIVYFYAFIWSFPYSLWLCTVNDLADYSTDSLNSAKGGMSGAKIKKKEFLFIKNLAVISLTVVSVPILLSGNGEFIPVSVAALVIPYMYSAKPFRLKERPLLDSLSNGAFVASVFISGYMFKYPGYVSREFLQAAAGFFFGVSALHIIAAMRDYTPDKKAGVTTIAVVLGKRISALISGLFFFLVLISIYNFPLEFRFYCCVGLVFTLLLFINQNEKLSKVLALTLLILFIVIGSYSVISGNLLTFFSF